MRQEIPKVIYLQWFDPDYGDVCGQAGVDARRAGAAGEAEDGETR